VTPLAAERERALKPGNSFKECNTCPEMIVMPGGSFLMGSPENELEGWWDQRPVHRVTFSGQFSVGRYSITFDEWDACVADGGCHGHRPRDQGWGRGRRPVVNVSWNDAKSYVAWLSRKTGKQYRLLSEAEREYVTRAGTTTSFWWGSTITTKQANYNGNHIYGLGKKGEWRKRTVPVDTFQPNPWGLYQVHGNVYEWVEDCWNDTYAGAPIDGSGWTSGKCSTRVHRGGSWVNAPKYLRAAHRGINNDANTIGFRVARTLD
jgi:formylglycine-generating enzyme required for sulfatase activity